MDFSKLKIYKFTLIFTVRNPIKIPYYAGSALRGVFGHALYKISPSSKIKLKNDSIDYNKICPYAHLFNKITPMTKGTESANFIVSPPQFGKDMDLRTGQELKFDFTIFNESINFIDAFILAWENALNRGVGIGQGTGELSQILLNDEYFDEEISSPLEINFTEISHDMELNFITPLRIKNNNRIMDADNFSVIQLMKSLAKRYNNLTNTQDVRFKEVIELCQDLTPTKNDLEIWHWVRKSNRQRQTMEFLGSLGHLRLPLTEKHQLLYDLLKIGEKTHTGKSTCFGLGKYKIIK